MPASVRDAAAKGLLRAAAGARAASLHDLVHDFARNEADRRGDGGGDAEFSERMHAGAGTRRGRHATIHRHQALRRRRTIGGVARLGGGWWIAR